MSCTFYFTLFFFPPSNNYYTCLAYTTDHLDYTKLMNTCCQCPTSGKKADPWTMWSCVPVLAWPKTIPFGLNCSSSLLVSLGVSAVTFGVLCQALLRASWWACWQRLLAGSRAAACPFPCYTVADAHWDLHGLQGWLFCSPADIPWVGRPFQP